MTKRKQETGIGLPVVIGLGICLLVSAVLILILSKVILGGSVPIGMLGVLGYLIAGLSALIGSLFAAKRARQLKLPCALATGAAYLLLLAVVNAIWEKGSFHGLLPTLGIVLGASTVAGLIDARKKRKKY